jgi:hypothetical protein
MAEVDFTPPMYTPMLKGKEGEFSALSVASPKTRAAMLPVIDVAPVPWCASAWLTMKRPLSRVSRERRKLLGDFASGHPLIRWLAPHRPGDFHYFGTDEEVRRTRSGRRPPQPHRPSVSVSTRSAAPGAAVLWRLRT